MKRLAITVDEDGLKEIEEQRAALAERGDAFMHGVLVGFGLRTDRQPLRLTRQDPAVHGSAGAVSRDPAAMYLLPPAVRLSATTHAFFGSLSAKASSFMRRHPRTIILPSSRNLDSIEPRGISWRHLLRLRRRVSRCSTTRATTPKREPQRQNELRHRTANDQRPTTNI